MTSPGSRSFVCAVVALLAACAHEVPAARPAATPIVQHQADDAVPDLQVFEPGPQRELYNDAELAQSRGAAAAGASREDEAEGQYALASETFVKFVRAFPDTGWSMVLLRHAAELALRARRWDSAAALGEEIASDPRADAASRALALLIYAKGQVGAGRAEAVRFPRVERWGAAPAGATSLPAPWQRFLDVAEEHLGAGEARPDPRSAATTARLALTAGELEWALGDATRARRNLKYVLTGGPDANAFAEAAPLYLDTFVAAGDLAGYEDALAVARQTADAGVAGGGTTADAYRRTVASLERDHRRFVYQAATALLEQGRNPEAARAFERLAELPVEDRGAALNDAAVAWERAGEAAKAASVRERILKEFPDSKAAPGVALTLAAERSEAGDHVTAARLYAFLAERSPTGPNRCLALRNGALELDRGGRPLDAAPRYLDFGRDAQCARSSPNAAALSLYRAGTLYREAKLLKPARQAFRAAAAVTSVSEAEAKRAVDAARKQLSAR